MAKRKNKQFETLGNRYKEYGLVHWDKKSRLAYFIFPYDHMPVHVHVIEFANKDDLIAALSGELITKKGKDERRETIPEMVIKLWIEQDHIDAEPCYRIKPESKYKNTTEQLVAIFKDDIASEKALLVNAEAFIQTHAKHFLRIFHQIAQGDQFESPTSPKKKEQSKLLSAIHGWLKTHGADDIGWHHAA